MQNKKKKIYRFIHILILFMLFCNMILVLPFINDNTVKAGTTYYVATTGDDGDSGDIDHPWESIDTSIDKLSAGDILYIRGGTYNEHVFINNKDGTSANWITIKNYPSETPIIDGDSPSVLILSDGYSAMPSTYGLFKLYRCDYILVDGLYVRDARTASDIVFQACNNTTIQNCHTYGSPYSGIRFTNINDAQTGAYSYDNKCLYNWVQLARHNYGSGTSNEALDIIACNRFEVAYNEVDDTNVYLGLTVKTASTNGIVHHNNLYSGEQCFYMGNSASPSSPARHQRNITIYNNWFHGGSLGSPVVGIGGETGGNYMENITFYNNIFDGTGGSAYEAFHSINPSSGVLNVENISFINNLFISVRTTTTLKAMKFSAPGSGGSFWWKNVVIKNNIFKCVGGDGILLSGLQDNHQEEMIIDHNLFYTGTEEDSVTPDWDIDSIIDDPDWVSSSDFHLQSTSPCIDAGNSTGAPSIDYDDLHRPMGGGYDIGPYEYYSETSEPNPPTDLTISSIGTTSLYLTWTKGSNAYKTRIHRKTTGYPTSISDGTNIYNGTENFFTDTGLTPGAEYYYRIWSYNGSCTSIYSTGYDSEYNTMYPNPPTSGILVLETTPTFHVNLTWTKGTGAGYTSILMKTGSYPTSYSDGTLIYNGDGTTCEYNITEGEPIYFKAWSRTSYDPPSYIKYSLTGLEFSTDLGMYINCFDEETGANLTFSVFITNHTGTELYINLSCTNTLIINTTLLPKGEDCQVIINATGYYPRVFTIDIYSSIITYLNAYLASNTTAYPYYLRVLETLYTTVDISVEDATFVIQRYEINEGDYVNISILKSDANGYVNLYLNPNVLYKVIISKTGYITELSNYIPQTPNEWGQTIEKIFKITKITDDDEPPFEEYLFNNITWSITPSGHLYHTSFLITFTILSSDNQLEYYYMRVWQYNFTSSTWTILYFVNNTDADGGTISYEVPNETGRYVADCAFKKTGYALHHLGTESSMAWVIQHLQEWMQTIPDWAYMFILTLIVAVIMGFLLTYMGTGLLTGYIGIGIYVMGLLLHPVTITVSEPSALVSEVSGWAIVTILIIVYTMGLYLWSKL